MGHFSSFLFFFHWRTLTVRALGYVWNKNYETNVDLREDGNAPRRNQANTSRGTSLPTGDTTLEGSGPLCPRIAAGGNTRGTCGVTAGGSFGRREVCLAWIIHEVSSQKRKDALKG